MTVIGVTGNSGAGKDTVSVLMKNELNALIIDADSLVKENQKIGCDYYDNLVKLLGEKILDDDKKINRGAFANVIFSNEETRNEVNKLTFECVKQKTEQIFNENKDKDYVILNFPLLYEGEFDKICKYVIAVIADEDTKIKRIIMRDKITKMQAEKRIASQKSETFYKENADFIIDNSSKINYGDLRKEILNVINKIKEKSFSEVK